MNFDLFPIQLIPSTKVGKVHLWDDRIKQIYEFDYAMPSLGANSGSVVYNRDGQLTEMVQDQPSWEFPLDGTPPVLKMRYTKTNLVNFAAPNTIPGTSFDGYTINPVGIELGNYTVTSVTQVQVRSNINMPSGPSKIMFYAHYKDPITPSFIVEMFDNENADNMQFYENGTTTGSNQLSDIKITDLGNRHYKYEFTVTFTAAQTNMNIDFQYGGTAQIGQKFAFGGFTVAAAAIDSDDVPGNNITRTYNSFTLDDLKTKNILGTNQFSIYFNHDNQFSTNFNNVGSGIRFIENGLTRFTLFQARGAGFTIHDISVGSYPEYGKRVSNKPSIITVSGNNVKFFYGGKKQIDYTNGNIVTGIDSLLIQTNTTNSSGYEILQGGLALSPIAIPDSVAATLTKN